MRKSKENVAASRFRHDTMCQVHEKWHVCVRDILLLQPSGILKSTYDFAEIACKSLRFFFARHQNDHQLIITIAFNQ